MCPRGACPRVYCIAVHVQGRGLFVCLANCSGGCILHAFTNDKASFPSAFSYSDVQPQLVQAQGG